MRSGRRIGSIVACAVALAGAGAAAGPPAALAGAGAASVHAAAAPLPPPSPPDAVKLSDERTLTRWAYPERRAVVYARPSARSRQVTRLRLLTEDRFPELYVVLSRWTDPSGNVWLQIRVPRRPNGTKAWVPQSALSQLNANHKLIVV